MNINLLNNFEGQWKYQQTLYSFKKKQIINYKNSMNIINLNRQDCLIYKIKYSDYQLVSEITKNQSNIKITKNNNNFLYKLNLSQKSRIKLSYKNKKVMFDEIFCNINENFFLVISILECGKQSIYINVTSFIKVL